MKLAIFCLFLACSGAPCAFAFRSTISSIACGFPALLVFRLASQNVGYSTPPAPAFEPSLALQKGLCLKKPVDTNALIRSAAVKHRVPAALVKSIVAAESNFKCDAISPKGAIGLMQLMPRTAMEYGADPHIPEQNIDAGTRYLRVLMDKYGMHRNSLKRVIAAYNAGPRTVDRYRGVPPFSETRGYVARVLSFLRRFEKQQG
jgi:soluble lytic murein transglycosylase-like protein